MTAATTTSAPSRLEHIVERTATFVILACLTFIAGLPKLDLSFLNLAANPHFGVVEFFTMVIFVMVVHAVFVAPGHRSSAEEAR